MLPEEPGGSAPSGFFDGVMLGEKLSCWLVLFSTCQINIFSKLVWDLRGVKKT